MGTKLEFESTFYRIFNTIFIVLFLIKVIDSSTIKTQFLKSNKRTIVGENSGLLSNNLENEHQRKRRALPTQGEIQQYVDKHNELRRLEGASNMHILKWNQDLAVMALLWAESCVWEHGQPEYNNPPFNPIGQNLFISTISVLDIDDAIQTWYDEKPDYDPSDDSCTPTKQCGHYTQIVWDETEEVGCAYAFCPTTANLHPDFRDAQYLVCNYGPAGNYPRAPYSVGPACTECSSGRFWCDDGLCRSDCSGPSSNCECRAACKNCASTDTQSCTCSCTPGWTGVDCTDECRNYHANCGGNPGWPPFWCTDQYPYVLNNCPLMCGLCEPADSSTGSCDTTTTTTTSTTTTSTTTSTTTPTTTTSTTTPTTTTSTTTPTTTTSTTTPTTTTSTTTPTTTTSSTTPTTTTSTTTPTTTTSTTTPTTTTSTSTTTPTTTTSTTTPTTTTQIDCSETKCVNGEIEVINQQCSCDCLAEWQGETCENRIDEARVGVIVYVTARASYWDTLWPFLQDILVDIINNYCNDHVDVCCPGSFTTRSGVSLTYLTENEILVGQGYPTELETAEVGNMRRYLTIAMLYAYGAEGNELCENFVSRRKRREIPESTLSQDTLYEIIDDSLPDIQQRLQDCCGVEIESVERAQVDGEEQDDEDDKDKTKNTFLGLQLWIWGLIIVLVLTLFILLLICCVCLARQGSTREKKYLDCK